MILYKRKDVASRKLVYKENTYIINILTRRREYGTYLATARRALQLMKAAVPAESYVIHLSSASLFSCDVYGQ